MNQDTFTSTGRNLEEISVDNIVAGIIAGRDIRISADALLRQAEIAAQEGRMSLAENFYRAAELTQIPDSEVLKLYDALRPGRSTKQELLEWIERLENVYRAERTVALIREAIQIYEKRGLLQSKAK